MMTFHFSDAARSVLLSLGWTEDRVVDIGEVVTNLGRRGYIPHDYAVGILKSFLGLDIGERDGWWVSFTNPAIVGGVFLQDQLLELNSELFVDLYPIGTTSLSCLFVNPSGVIFSVDCDRYSWHSYRSIERMMEVMLRIDKSTPEEMYILLRG